jgi:hypothetical protein
MGISTRRPLGGISPVGLLVLETAGPGRSTSRTSRAVDLGTDLLSDAAGTAERVAREVLR